MGLHLTSGNFFLLARKAYERSKTDTSEAMTSILMSWIAFETFFNELVELAAASSSDEPEKIRVFRSVLSDMEKQKTSLGTKIQMTYFIFKRRRLDTGSLPYQDFDLLIDIRNTLVHRKPERIDFPADGKPKEYEPHKYVRRLAERRVIPLPPKQQPTQLLSNIRKPEVARWAYNVTIQMIKLLKSILPPSYVKRTATFITKGLKEIP